MNLQTTIDLYAGGVGSGCHGENCGRPSTGHVDYLAQKVGGQGGSNPGGVYRGSDGIDRYVKFYRNPGQGRGEALANTIYNDLGIKAPKSTVFKTNGKEAFASEIIKDGKETLENVSGKAKFADKVLDGFAADVLVSNWDVVGLTYDNILVGKSGDVYRIDNGGSFLYRAQGGDKPAGLLNKISEYDGLFNPSVNSEFSSLMKKAGYTSADELGGRIKQQVGKIVGLQKKYGGWDNYVSEKAPYIKGSEKTKIVDMLDSRTKLLQQRVSSIKAGGVGSGCHGSNCGRKSSGSSGPIKGEGWVLPNGRFEDNNKIHGHYDTAQRLGYGGYHSAFEAGLIRVQKTMSSNQLVTSLETTKEIDDGDTKKRMLNIVSRLPKEQQLGNVFVTMGAHTYTWEKGKGLERFHYDMFRGAGKGAKKVNLKAAIDLQCFIKKEGSQHCVKSESGKNLGCSPTRTGAEKRLRQVEYFKHLKAGGPGSGRHPGFGNYKKVSSNPIGGGYTRTTYEHARGGRVFVDDGPKGSRVHESTDPVESIAVYHGSKAGAQGKLAADYGIVHAGGPGSGRKPEKFWRDMTEKEKLKESRRNQSQMSIYGPGHREELRKAKGLEATFGQPGMVQNQSSHIGHSVHKAKAKAPKYGGHGIGTHKGSFKTSPSIRADEGGEPMVGNMARNTQTEQNDWFDPKSKRGTDATKAISSGGSGSGCHGANCGRPSTGGKKSGGGKVQSIGKVKSLGQVKSLVKSVGLKNLVKADYWKASSHLEDCQDEPHSCNEKKLPALARVYAKMGLTSDHLEQYNDLMSEWTSSSNKKFAGIAQDVIAGKLKTPMAKAMAVDWAITQMAIKGNSVQLYRGVEGAYARNVLKDALKAKDTEIVVKSRGADSWADSKSQASSFGQLILTQRVPKEYVISTWRTNRELADMHENEFVVAYPKGKIRLDRQGLDIGDADFAAAEKKKTVVVDLTSKEEANWLHGRRKKKVEGVGEPDIPDFNHGHMDVSLIFHPPSLKNPQRVPSDDPRETNDRFLDVTKRKQAQKQRGDLLRRSAPGGNPPLIPARTTMIAPHMGIYQHGMFSAAKKPQKVIQRPAKIIGAKRTSIPLGRAY